MKPFRAKARRAKRQPNYRLDDTLHKRSDTDYSFNQTSKPCVEDWLWSRREMERYDGFIYQQHKEMKVKNVINPGTDCRQQWHEAVIRLHQIRLGFHSIPAEVWPRSRAQTVGMNFIKIINLPAVIIRRREEKEKKKTGGYSKLKHRLSGLLPTPELFDRLSTMHVVSLQTCFVFDSENRR